MAGGHSGLQAWLALARAAVLIAVTSGAASGQSPSSYLTVPPRQLLAALPDAPHGERPAMAEAMVMRRAELVPAARQAARTGTVAEKLVACSYLAEVRDHGGLDAVLAASADSEVPVRRRAATALRILADPRSAPRLRELVRLDADSGVVKSALAALGRIGERSDRGVVEPFLGHPDPGVRVVAAGVLAMLGDERGLAMVLAGTAQDADPGLQKTATYALGFFADPAAAARLQAILDDPQGAWKSYALIAQGERRLAGQPPAGQVTILGELARGRSRTLAQWAVDRLTDLGTPDAVAALRAARTRPTAAGAMAARRVRILEAQP